VRHAVSPGVPVFQHLANFALDEQGHELPDGTPDEVAAHLGDEHPNLRGGDPRKLSGKGMDGTFETLDFLIDWLSGHAPGIPTQFEPEPNPG
jgi:hypothetical protein